jgi:hypothetical protein
MLPVNMENNWVYGLTQTNCPPRYVSSLHTGETSAIQCHACESDESRTVKPMFSTPTIFSGGSKRTVSDLQISLDRSVCQAESFY